MMRSPLFMAAFGFLVFTAACGTGATDPSEAVSVKIDAPAVAVQGEPIAVTFTVTNQTDRTIKLPLVAPGEAAFDIFVSKEDGSLVWRRREGPQAHPAGVLVLEPNASRTFTATWDLRDSNGQVVPQGSYRIRGVLESENGRTIDAQQIVQVDVTAE